MKPRNEGMPRQGQRRYTRCIRKAVLGTLLDEMYRIDPKDSDLNPAN